MALWACFVLGGKKPLRKETSINHQDPPPYSDNYLSGNLTKAPFQTPFAGYSRPVRRKRTREKETAKDWTRAQTGLMESGKEHSFLADC